MALNGVLFASALFAVVLAVDWLGEVAAQEPTCPEHDFSDTKPCPVDDPRWATATGVQGVVVTTRGLKRRNRNTKRGLKGQVWANETVSQIYYKPGLANSGECYQLCQIFSYDQCFNEADQRCSYWTYDKKRGDCWLFDCTACVGPNAYKDAFKARYKRSVSGAGPQSCGNGGVDGDPHFTGADSSHFDFSGVPNTSYCLVSDSHIHINAYFGGRYGEYEGNPHKALTWIRKVGILWGHHTILLEARSGPRWQYDNGYMANMEVDGQKVSLSQMGDEASLYDGAIKIEWVAAREQSADDAIDVYRVTIPGVLDMVARLRPEVEQLRVEEDGTVHFDLEFVYLAVTHTAHGILGQTYRRDRQGKLAEQELKYSELLQTEVVPGDNAEGFLDGSVDDYETKGILSADCKVARFARFQHFDVETSQILDFLSKSTSVINGLSSPRKMLNGAVSRVSNLLRKRR